MQRVLTILPTEGKSAAATGPMRAAVVDRYGGSEVVRIADVARPSIGTDDVLLEVCATCICRGDVHLLAGKPYLIRLAGYGVLRPRHRIPGLNVSGRVIAAGSGVTDFRLGDEVFGEIPFGAFAELAAAPGSLLALKPTSLGHEEAAAVPVSGLTALQGLRDVGKLRAGQSVLINGASGGVGTFAVQIAKAMGAEVTAVCSTRHVDVVRHLGADRVVDYTQQDFAKLGLAHDVMLDLVGNRSLSDCKRVLKRSGILVAGSGSTGGNWIGPVAYMLKVALVGSLSSQSMSPFLARPNRGDLQTLAQMIEGGKVRPVVERRYPLGKIADALAHVAAGNAQGTTVIAVADR